MNIDSNVFETLYEKYYSQIYNYIFYRVLDKHLAEDLVGEVFLKILTKINYYDESRDQTSAWVITIAKNTFIDYYRKSKPKNFTENCFDYGEDMDILEDSKMDIENEVGYKKWDFLKEWHSLS